MWPEAIVLLPVLRTCDTLDAFKEQATHIVPSLNHLIRYFTKVCHQHEVFNCNPSCEHIEDVFIQKEEFATRLLRTADYFLSASWLRLFVVRILVENPDIPSASNLQQTLMAVKEETQLLCRHTESIKRSQRIEHKRILATSDTSVRKRVCVGTETVLYKIELKGLCDQATRVTQNFLTVAQNRRFGLDGWLWASDARRQPPLPPLRLHHVPITLELLIDFEQQQRHAINDSSTHIFLFLNAMSGLQEQLFRHHRSFRMCVFHGRFTALEQCIVTYHLCYTSYIFDMMIMLMKLCITMNIDNREHRRFIANINIALLEE